MTERITRSQIRHWARLGMLTPERQKQIAEAQKAGLIMDEKQGAEPAKDETVSMTRAEFNEALNEATRRGLRDGLDANKRV